MNYLLSVVVPTKNRYIYLEKLVELIVKFNTNQIELVIQDNSEDNHDFIDFITNKKNKCAWIKYYYEKQYLTSVENFDMAISHCTGEYICFIGDDDGVVRNITHYTEWMKDNNIEALRSAPSTYYWTGRGRYSQYATFEPSKRQIEWLCPIHELEKVIKRGCRDLGRIPVLYTGIVKKNVLDAMYCDLGTYFPGVSPDAANGTVLSYYVKRYVYVNTPIVITGTSAVTGGGIQKKRIVPINEISFLRPENFIEWEGTIPSFWTGTLVWPISVISGLRKLGKQNMLTLFDFDCILSNFYYANRDYKKEALKYAHNKYKFYFFYYSREITVLTKDVFDKIIRVFSRYKRYYGGYIYYNLKSIIEAEELFYQIDSNFRKNEKD